MTTKTTEEDNDKINKMVCRYWKLGDEVGLAREIKTLITTLRKEQQVNVAEAYAQGWNEGQQALTQLTPKL